MINLIMLCGQGSVGKSTYAKNNFQKSYIVSMDAIVKKNDFNSNFKEQYINLIQQKINAKEDTIVLDFSHDGILSRKSILSKLKLSNDIIFTTIALRPGVEQIIYNQEKRQKHPLTDNEKERIIKIYNNFEYPTEEEFKDYGFYKINNFVVDNSY